MTIATATSLPTAPAAVEFALLQSLLASGNALQLPLHEIECQQQAKGREVQRLLLQTHLQQRGNGDVGPALYLQHQDGDLLYSHRRLGTRALTTVFGTVELIRMRYSRPGVPGIFPLYRALTLPARSFSYELQRRLVKAAVQNPFLDSVQTIADLTGVSVSKRSLEQMLPDAAQDFDAFYRQRSPEPATGSILVAAVDCKGIPMVKPPGTQPTPRLTKGQKANKKRMATVAAVFTRAPWVRTPQQVVESLFRLSRPTPDDAPTPPRPENKRVWASLLKGKNAVIQDVAEEMERRDPSASKTRVALTDGERALQIRVDRKLKVPGPGSNARSGETVESRLCLSCRGQPGGRSLGPGPHPANPVRRGEPGRQGAPSKYHQTQLLRSQTQNAPGSRRLPLPEPHPNALSPIPRQRLADRQWSRRRGV